MLKSLLRRVLDRLPHDRQRALFKRLARVPLLRRHRLLAGDHWVSSEYHAFGMAQRKQIFLSIARFAHINRPIGGYYMEFGSHEANTMRLAWDTFRHLFDWTYVSFDSFEGLPEMEDFDRSDIFRAGNLATAEEHFIGLVTGHGMPRDKLMTVKGFYDQSLTPAVRARLEPKKAAVVYVDCDLYASTVPVLAFVRPFLQKGTVIVFDDWNCYHGDPDLGERKAWREFLEANPDLRFVDFVSTAEGQAFICVDPGAGAGSGVGSGTAR
jgi:hypothetical protein